MTKVRTPKEKSKKQQDNTNTHDYTTTVDRLKTVSWGNDSHPNGVVKAVYGIPTFLITAKVCHQKDTHSNICE